MSEVIKKVLLMEASSRQVLPIARELYRMNYDVTTVCEKKTDLGYVTRYKTRCLVFDDVDSNVNLANEIYSKLVEENLYDIVLPLSDFSAEIAARNKEYWNRLGCYVAVNELDTFLLAFDKLNTMRVCMDNNIPCPKTFLAENEYSVLKEDINYPVVIKPRSGCGSIGFHIVNDRTSLENVLKNNINGPLLVQEFIPQNGKQYNAHFLLDENHEVKSFVCTEKCRWFPLDGGASTMCRTIENDLIYSNCETLLKKIKWVGYCDIDLMEDPRDGSIRIIEINARISANIKICMFSGVNVVKQIVELSESKPVTSLKSYKKDYKLRCIHTDVLWFIKSSKRFSTNPSWFSVKNTTDQIFAFSDPIPVIVFSFSSLFKYKKEMEKRKR